MSAKKDVAAAAKVVSKGVWGCAIFPIVIILIFLLFLIVSSVRSCSSSSPHVSPHNHETYIIQSGGQHTIPTSRRLFRLDINQQCTLLMEGPTGQATVEFPAAPARAHHDIPCREIDTITLTAAHLPVTVKIRFDE